MLLNYGKEERYHQRLRYPLIKEYLGLLYTGSYKDP